MNEQKLVPELRFPGFEGEWERASLTNYAELISGTHLAPDEYEDQGEVPYFTGPSDFTNSLDDVEKWTGKKKNQAIHGDVLITVKGNGVGLLWPLMLERVAMGRQLMAIRSKPDAEANFIFQLLSMYKQQYQALASGNLIPGLSRPDILGMKLSFPCVSEQQKIANFLSSVDAKLAKLGRKKALLEDYKRGLMQQIFSQKIRFKQDDGSEFSEWDLCLFSDLYSWVRTNNLSREFLTNQISKVQNIHYGDIHTRFPALFKQSDLAVPYIESEAFISSILNEEYCRVGDIVIADASEDYLDIGKAIEIIQVEEHSLVAGLHTYIARPKKKLALGFSGYMMRSPSVRRSTQQIAQGVSVLGVSKTNIGLIEVRLPVYEEQQKIADFLFSLDQKIDVVAKQIEQLEAFKKGLLQKLFV